MEVVHRKKRKSYDLEGHLHELTFSCYRRRPLLNDDATRRSFLDSMENARTTWGFRVLAYVLMPEHVHLLVAPETCKVRDILKSIKQPMARRAISRLERTEPMTARWVRRPGDGQNHSFWQAGGGYDRNLTKTKDIWKVIDYIHMNPVRRGLVENPIDWKWSSARNYVDKAPFAFLVDRYEGWLF